jgi:DNA-binding Xre family transcriptional regulator
MAHTYAELKRKTVAQLREIAAEIEHPAVQGHTQMNKEHLLEAICRALNIDMHEHHEVVGVDKMAIKAKIRAMKKKRDEAISARDISKLRATRDEIHQLKRQLRKATV